MARRYGIISPWLHQQRAQHSADLAAPQPFPLTGDGEHTAALYTSRLRWDGGKLADARYRDWLAAQKGGRIGTA